MTQVAYMLLTTKYGKEQIVADALLEIEEVENVHILYGQYDLIVKMHAKDMRQLEDVVLQKIRAHPDIETSETLIASDISSV